MTAADPRSWMWAEACAMIERAEQLHRQFFRPGLARAPAANWEPPVDVFESEHELTIVAALPGVEAQDIEISIDGDALLIAGVRRLPAVEPDATALIGRHAPWQSRPSKKQPIKAASRRFRRTP